jgi:transcriptional regulator with XRE-family HTH domain
LRIDAGNVTFRFVQKGWKATGLLEPLWGKVGGRDELARKTGINPATLSGVNTGRLNLGRANAERIAQVLEVSLVELGAPEGEADDVRSQSLVDLLGDLRAVVDAQQKTIDSQGRSIRALQGRIRALEQARATARPARGGA